MEKYCLLACSYGPLILLSLFIFKFLKIYFFVCLFVLCTSHSFFSLLHLVPCPQALFYSFLHVVLHHSHSEMVRPPMGVSKVWHSQLRQDQTTHTCIKAGQGIPSQGIGSYTPKDNLLRGGNSHSGLDPVPLIINHEMPHRSI